jgi:hypothetical protein
MYFTIYIVESTDSSKDVLQQCFTAIINLEKFRTKYILIVQTFILSFVDQIDSDRILSNFLY